MRFFLYLCLDCPLQGGGDPPDTLSLQVIFCKRALKLVALLRKMTCNLRHPMGLRHPVLLLSTTLRAAQLVNMYPPILHQSALKRRTSVRILRALSYAVCVCMHSMYDDIRYYSTHVAHQQIAVNGLGFMLLLFCGSGFLL